MTFVNHHPESKRVVLRCGTSVTTCGMPKTTTRPAGATEQLRQAGLRLAAAREAMRLSQDQLAKQIGASRTALANWEGGTRKPDVLALARAQEIGIPMEWVMLGNRRHIEFGIMNDLEEACARMGAVMDGPVASWPMAAERRQAVDPRAPSAAAAPRRNDTALHETPKPPAGMKEHQTAAPRPGRKRGRPPGSGRSGKKTPKNDPPKRHPAA
ncbi:MULTISPECIES: helix-turn-helix domain-containing protein [Roseomonadaceae]|uniref:Helix-turn-helix transcriptional regulator n=1 Tax=Falsiroseomonas oleicola TaxID=2801474 RepID=A0ABS6H5N2_9PROT|nr:helix-turn-helix transcriptional regulator [Roseomonas oleicola]MBU8543976.1 helix-turn-helix transcriptional regulator [Roseomonas oleicola]